jgi:hypothetical protein
MNETRKRKLCCGLSSCCGKTRSESAQMIAGKSTAQPLTMGQKCGNCCCWPFRKISNPFKRRKVDSMDAKTTSDHEKPSMWERICCCSGCCRRCKKGDSMESMAKVSGLSVLWTGLAVQIPSCFLCKLHTLTPYSDSTPYVWFRLLFLRFASDLNCD